MRGLVEAVRKTAWAPLCLAAALLWAAGARNALAGRTAWFNLDIIVNGFAAITDLSATPGSSAGSINLSWTEPGRNGVTAPLNYDIRVSSLSQISSTSDFNAALPLSSFSPSTIPSVGTAGAAAGMTVSGLSPGVTYYFAIRAEDSAVPQHVGNWLRSVPQAWNVDNYAQAYYAPGSPNAVANLSVAPYGVSGQALLSWTAPAQLNGVVMSSYTIVYSTVSIASLGGNTTTWFNLASATRTTLSPVLAAGQPQSLVLSDLPGDTTVYFGLKSVDILGEVSPIDTEAAGVTTQASIDLTQTIDLTASSSPVVGRLVLSWVEPSSATLTAPLSYVIRVSTSGNIDTNAAFALAAPLSSFSTSTIPSPGAGGSTVTFVVDGLDASTTYYFAIREVDSSAPPVETNWFRDASLGLNQANFAVTQPNPFPASVVTDLSAAPGAAEGAVALTWTAPTQFLASYTIHYATFSIASLSDDTTAWWNATTAGAVVFPDVSTGTPTSYAVNGLFPLSTWYFAIRTTDLSGRLSLIDGRAQEGNQAQSMPDNVAPPAPAGFAAVNGLEKASLSWSDLTTAQKGLAFGFYKLYRSTQSGTGFVQITTTTATSYVDRPLTAFVTYYYQLTASELPGGLEGSAVASSTAPFVIIPQEPFGFTVTPASTSVTFSWAPTENFGDGTPFINPVVPSTQELAGYKVFRSTDICNAPLVQISTLTVSSTTFSDYTMGDDYYYQVFSFNSVGVSTDTLAFDALGQQHYFLNDCASQLVIPLSVSATLNKGANPYGNIMVSGRYRSQDLGGAVMQSVEFEPMLNGVTLLKNFYLPSPATYVLHYSTDATGAPTPDAVNPAAQNLGIFWDNGGQFQKMYGTVNTLDQTVSVQTPNFGIYQIRTQLRSQSGPVFDVSNVSAKVITPNGDGLNDVFIVTYDPGPDGVVPSGVIYDLHGAVVASMTPGLVPNTLTWDGKMNGRPVTSGVYIYQIKGGGQTFNGTVVVAR